MIHTNKADKVQAMIFIFPIDPVAWERTRTRSNQHFTAPKTRRFQAEVKWYARLQYKGAPLTGAISIHIEITLQRPKTVKRKHPSIRPDWDNFGKSICDALNEIVYVDDGQIVDGRVTKRYGEKGGIRVAVEEVF